MMLLFQTGYMMNRYVFPWEPAELVHPTGNSQDGWTIEHRALGENSMVLAFAASGKTSLGFTYFLKHERPAWKRPRYVIGVGSIASKAFTEATGFHDKVLTYDPDSGNLSHQLTRNEGRCL